MGPVRQNPIQRTVRTAHLSVYKQLIISTYGSILLGRRVHAATTARAKTRWAATGPSIL